MEDDLQQPRRYNPDFFRCDRDLGAPPRKNKCWLPRTISTVLAIG